ncbi:replication restart helicase PriA [Candidatus Cytomitobacter primus]|uniref:replication restart helicase PriA n=1 Tax=Candidatus Cytomitobacter primus TaxID=2066024 RepID=UPI00165366BA|nr:primosomal protein N' [Candidatus Cytomitobacter primus]
MSLKFDVLLPYSWTNDELYTYKSNKQIEPGTLVSIPIQNREIIGLVIRRSSDNNCVKNLKEVKEVLNYHLNAKTIKWMNIASKYTLIPMHQILKMILVSYKNNKPGYFETNIIINNLEPGKYPLEMLKTNWIKLKKMIKEGEISETKFPTSSIPIDADFFSDDQIYAINQINHMANQHHIITLQGSTGSGKTNVYFEAIAKALEQKKQVLVLVPEISLTSQLIERFHDRFKVYPYRWYNSCKQPIWDWASKEESGVLIGVRSALWAPFNNLGLIIVDEEHSTTYKQENGPRYNAKDIAILKAKSENIPIILVSATPSLETLHNIQTSNYKHIQLTRTIPHKLNIQLVKTKTWMSTELQKHIQITLNKKEQVMLFLNRKGFSTHIYCSTCSNRLLCKACTAGLIFHKSNHTHCSYCAQKSDLPSACPECKAEDSWKFYGLGIEKIHENIQKLFPNNIVSILSSDTTEVIDETMHKMENSEIDILIGTQILAQGCHFPNLTLVGIVQGDIGIHSGDIRNTERMYQLISQVKGRCGRADKPGTVIIQTSDDSHPLLHAIAHENVDHWLEQELQIRKQHNLPPFSRIIRIIISSKSAALTEKIALSIHKPKIPGIEIMGPAPAQLYKYNNDYRWSFLIQYNKKSFPQLQISKWIQSMKLPKNIKLTIDVDPQSFF